MRFRLNPLVHSVVITLAIVLGARDVRGQIIYSNDFEGAVGSEWSQTGTSVTPIGARRFLGEFGGVLGGIQNVSLTLASLPAHSQLNLSFDLFIIRSWDGTSTNGGHSDTFRVDVQGGSNLFLATFADNFNSTTEVQSYPGTFPTSLFPHWTGAAETNTLGYFFIGGGGVPVSSDSVYRVSLTFDHTASSVQLNFISNLNGALFDESWGLDNVKLAIVPEPSSLGLCMIAAAGLSLRLRCKKSRSAAN